MVVTSIAHGAPLAIKPKREEVFDPAHSARLDAIEAKVASLVAKASAAARADGTTEAALPKLEHKVDKLELGVKEEQVCCDTGYVSAVNRYCSGEPECIASGYWDCNGCISAQSHEHCGYWNC